MSLTREQLLNAVDREIVPVEVPEWGGTVSVRSLSAAEQLALEGKLSALKDAKDLGQVLSLQIAAYVCDEFGAALFDDESAAQMMSKKGQPIRRIIDAAKKLNAWTEEEKDAIRGN